MSTNAQAGRFLDRHGRDATLRTFTATGGKDNYQDPEFNDADTTIKVFPKYPGNERTSRNPRGEESIYDVLFLADDEETFKTGNGDRERRSLIQFDGEWFQIHKAPDLGNGYRKLYCTSARTP